MANHISQTFQELVHQVNAWTLRETHLACVWMEITKFYAQINHAKMEVYATNLPVIALTFNVTMEHLYSIS